MQTGKQQSVSVPKKPQVNHNNFIEALKSNAQSMASDVATGLTTDLFGGMMNDAADSLFGGSSAPKSQYPEINFDEFMHSQDNELEIQKRLHFQQMSREFNQTEQVLFDRKQEELTKKIELIRQEMQALARSVVRLESSSSRIVFEEIVDPGTYHLSLFEKVLLFLRQIKKRVDASANWLSMHQERGKSKSYFWQQANAKVGGTKYLLSEERSKQTQMG